MPSGQQGGVRRVISASAFARSRRGTLVVLGASQAPAIANAKGAAGCAATACAAVPCLAVAWASNEIEPCEVADMRGGDKQDAPFFPH
jgi:hypothetical protein